MTSRLTVLFTLTLELIVATGCRNSAKTTQATPTPSPTPAAPAPIPPAPVAAGTPSRTVLELPIHVKPPASFSAEQLPTDQPVRFMVRGDAGQFLRMKVDAVRFDPMHSVEAQLPDGSGPLPAIREGGDSAGNFVYRLPETGDYPIELNTAGRDAGVEFTLLPSDDPMVTAGIQPEEISIDFGPFAKRQELTLEIFGQYPGYMDDWQPTHWAVQNRHLEFRIMQVAGYKKTFDHPDRQDDLALIENLEVALKPGATVSADLKLPYPDYGDAGLEFSTRPQVLAGAGWRGLRFIGAITNDTGCSAVVPGPPTHLVYSFEGLSDDGRFFIKMRAWISNLELERRLDQECRAGAKARDPQSDPFLKKEMPALFDRDISAADPASFKPNVDQLDAVIRSLKLKPSSETAQGK